MDQDADFAQDAAGEVLSRMIIDGGPHWVVLEVVRHEEVTSPPTDPSGVSHLRISLGEEPGGSETSAVYFTAGVPRQDAVVATASQIQDHAIEATHGSALPLCPGHHHPLGAGVRHGVAYWTCPKDPSHHSEPILNPAGR
jgi:hypothetical protein